MEVQEFNSMNLDSLNKQQSSNYSDTIRDSARISYNTEEEGNKQVKIKQFAQLQISPKDQELLRKLLRKRAQILNYKKAYNKLKSKNIGRRKHIQQLVMTQTSYKNDLKLIWQQIREPLIYNSLITKEQERIIFSNLNGIRELNIELEKQLSETWQNFHFFQKFGNILTKKAPFFQIYIEYLNNYLEGEKYLKMLRQKNQLVNQILKNFQTKNKQDTTSYLVKPVQRLQKYRILLSPILQKTDPEHPDYKNLTEAHKKFCETVEKVNAVKDKIQRNKRIQQLDKLYTVPDHPILTNNRQYFFQQNLLWICNQGKIPVLACFFNDLILFISKHQKHHHNKIVLRLKWNQKSIIKDMEDGKKMTNVISISAADGSATVSTGEGRTIKERNTNRNTKQRLIQDITNLMIKSLKKSGPQVYNVQVRALGTQQINSTSLSKHTIYILEVKIGQLRQNIYIRFNEMLVLKQDILKVYKHLHNKPLPILQKRVFNHNSQTIQTRKFMIQQYLQTILNDQQIIKHPQFILKELNLKKNFYQLPAIIAEKRRNSQYISQIYQQSQQITGEQILCATEVNLGKCLYNIEQATDIDHNSNNHASIEVKMHTGQIITLKINESTTVQDLCNNISKKNGLLMNRDFRIFHEIGKKQIRVLDPEQIIMKIFNLKEQKKHDLFSRVKQAIKGAIVPDTKPILIFKKYYYLPSKKEQIQLRKDLVRVRLISYQIFAEIKQMKYLLNFEDYVQFCAFYLYLDLQGEIDFQKKIDVFVAINKIVPEVIYKNQNIHREKWSEKITNFLKKLVNEINNMISHNRQKIKQLKKNSKLQFYTDKIILCYRTIINKIRSNSLATSNIFFIQPHQKTLSFLQKKGLIIANQNHNMWLAINYEGFSFLKPASKQLVLSIKFDQILSKIVQPQSLVFTINQDDKQVEYKFKTWQSFQISQLVEYNRALHQILKNMRDSNFRQSELSKKTQVYMMQRSIVN